VALGLLSACASSNASTPVDPAITFATAPPTVHDTTAVPTTLAASATGSPPASTGLTTSTPTTAVPGSTVPDAPPAVVAPEVALRTVGTFSQPVDIAWRTGDPTAFVVQQGGIVLPVRDGTAGAPVLDISKATVGEGERGLLGLAFSPDGSHAYIDHTDLDGNTVIAEYAVDAAGTFDPTSRRELLHIKQPYPNHNGGNVMFGPDGDLYIGMGDGGNADDPGHRGLNPSTLLGKVLRIDPHPSGAKPYTVPADNPFVGVKGAQPEIWAVGVRNPWRMSFDRPTGDLWIADVGQDQWEEVDVAWADADGRSAGRGMNFGWAAYEGTHVHDQNQVRGGETPPLFDYPHGDLGCSISGGAVYRGTAIPALAGWYVHGDYCSGILTAVQMDGHALVGTGRLGSLANTVAVRAAPDGELYVVSGGGEVAEIVPA
jgi:glucose/arabinose dehydrogenase